MTESDGAAYLADQRWWTTPIPRRSVRGRRGMSLEQWSETILLVELSDDPQLTDDLVQVIEQCTKDPRQDVLLNMSRVTYLNSSNIAKLLKLRKLVTIANQRRLKMACVSTRVWGVFLVTGLDRIFDFVDDVPSGLAGLQIGD